MTSQQLCMFSKGSLRRMGSKYALEDILGSLVLYIVSPAWASYMLTRTRLHDLCRGCTRLTV